jgi:glutamate racemase
LGGVIGVFDSGFGGLTILQGLLDRLPGQDYLFLADNARAPYGARSFGVIHDFTREAVDFLFRSGCSVVILACNTASARALRNLQQHWLPEHWPDRRLLGVVRPSVEALANLPVASIPGQTPASTVTGKVALVATSSTVASNSFALELAKFAPALELVQQACPLWVPLIENGEIRSEGARFYVRKYLEPIFSQVLPPERLLLGCTHYPLLLETIREFVPDSCEILSQATLVAERFADWVDRHPEFRDRLGQSSRRTYMTTDDPEWFKLQARMLLGIELEATQVRLQAQL